MATLIKTPDQTWLNSYIAPQLLSAKPYTIIKSDAKIKIDQNESPFDWPLELKDTILAKLREQSWNRYPDDYSLALEDAFARYAGVTQGSVLVTPGSNLLISLIIQLFGTHAKGDVYAADPSFPLYREVCRNLGINCKLWDLDDRLEYVPNALKGMKDGSLVIFATPNNPVGNALSKSDFKALLREHPRSFFVADEAYCEFVDEDYTDLFADFSNFLSVRTFSKGLQGAGLRLGYVVAHPSVIHHLRKIVLPYLLNRFTLTAALTILEDRSCIEEVKRASKEVCAARELVYAELKAIAEKMHAQVYPSTANFLLIRWPDVQSLQTAQEILKKRSILLRAVNHPRLTNCLRLTIGSKEENKAIIAAFAAMVPAIAAAS